MLRTSALNIGDQVASGLPWDLIKCTLTPLTGYILKQFFISRGKRVTEFAC